jgi:hypothetical protein
MRSLKSYLDKYIFSNHYIMPAIGSRAQVMNGTAHHTKGGLTKKHLKYNKHGRIVSRKASMKAKKNNRLAKAGFVPKKGVFKLFKKGDGKKSRKMRGGMAYGGPLSPLAVSGLSGSANSLDVQSRAGMGN